jgi:HEAT repeat protein
VPDLIRALDDPQVSYAAIHALGEVGPGATAAVPALVVMLSDRFVGRYASAALVRIGPAAVPALIPALSSKDAGVRYLAAEALGEIGPEARAAGPALMRMLARDEDFTTAFRAIVRLGLNPETAAAIPLAADRLNRMRWESTEFEAIILGLSKIGAPPLRMLIKVVESGDEGSHPDRAIDFLRQIGPPARPALPALLVVLKGKLAERRMLAAAAIVAIDPDAADVLDVLRGALRDEETRDDAARALRQLGPVARRALPDLIEAMERDPSEAVVLAVITLDPEGRRCLPSLLRALKDEDYQVRGLGATALGRLDPIPIEALPELARVFRDEKVLTEDYGSDWHPIGCVAAALSNMGPRAAPALPTLLDVLQRGDIERRRLAAKALGAIGPAAKAAVPTLRSLVEDARADPQLRAQVIHALGRIGPAAGRAVPALFETLEFEARNLKPPGRFASTYHQEIYHEAAVALVHIDPSSIARVESILDIRENFHTRALVASAVGRSPKEAEAMTRLRLETLKPWIPRVDGWHAGPLDQVNPIEQILDDLADLGPGARAAIPRLEELRSHPNPFFRRKVRATLDAIRKSAGMPASH